MSNNIIIDNNTNRFGSGHAAGYQTDEIQNNRVITLPVSSTAKATAIKEVNKTLCGLLIFAILISIVSYYFVVDTERQLNECSRETTKYNVENAELQNQLDRKKSFNNVDKIMQKSNLLQTPKKVIETVDVRRNIDNGKKQHAGNYSKPKVFTMGY